MALVGLSIAAAGCASRGVSTTAAHVSSSGAPTASTQKAGVGDTIDLSDGANGTNIAVTVVRVVDPDSSANQFETPSPGDRFESVQFRISNTGTRSYQDDPLAEVSAKDSSGQNMQQAIVTSTAAGAQMPSAVNLAPGDVALGYVTFDVPSGDKITQAQYSLNAGLVGTTGEWQIENAQSPTAAAPASPSNSPVASASNGSGSAEAVVEQYFAAINDGNYAAAWLLGGKNIEQGSYDSFVQGFAGTTADDVTVLSVSGNTVTVQLDATQTDGTHKYFAGTYTVENGVIVSADIH
ncbi:MAG TPA: DUF4352 domain-containing protein [Actinospica sp.]|nr:DUF4352 domain-containing protein [Actinospica sp.]